MLFLSGLGVGLFAFILSCFKLIPVRLPLFSLFVVIDEFTQLMDCFDYDNDNDRWRWLWT